MGEVGKAGAVDRGRIIKCLVKHFWHLELVLMALGKTECEGKWAKERMHREKQSEAKIRTIAAYIKQLRRKQPRLPTIFKAPLMFQYAWSICPFREFTAQIIHQIELWTLSKPCSTRPAMNTS